MENDIDLLKDDLVATVKELSASYEELSLLYQFSENLSGLDVDGICSKVIDESLSYVGAETAAVMLLDEASDELFTKDYRGRWKGSFTLRRDDSPLWQAVEKRRSIAICNVTTNALYNILPQLTSILICPMIGKKKAIGLLIVANKLDNEEYYSNDIKLISAIARQASLFIENVMLSREMENFLIGTIRSFVKVLEASSLWTAGHTERVTEYALAVGNEMGLNAEELERLKICSLLHDIGKIATPKEILNKSAKLSDDEWGEIKNHPSVGAEILDGLEKFTDINECIKYHHEHFDGNKGIHGLKGEEIPLLARILAVADAFDAMTSDRPYRKKKSLKVTVLEIVSMSGTQFDPKVVKAFKSWIDKKKIESFLY